MSAPELRGVATEASVISQKARGRRQQSLARNAAEAANPKMLERARSDALGILRRAIPADGNPMARPMSPLAS